MHAQTEIHTNTHTRTHSHSHTLTLAHAHINTSAHSHSHTLTLTDLYTIVCNNFSLMPFRSIISHTHVFLLSGTLALSLSHPTHKQHTLTNTSTHFVFLTLSSAPSLLSSPSLTLSHHELPPTSHSIYLSFSLSEILTHPASLSSLPTLSCFI